MSTGYQIKEQGELYYLTFQVVHWVDLFTRPVYRDHAVILYLNNFTAEKIDYIHHNQVRVLLVQNPEDYLYSSARNYAGLSAVLDVELLSLPWKTVR